MNYKNNYSHFAVRKNDNQIVNGWNYSGYDSEELNQFKTDYFWTDMYDIFDFMTKKEIKSTYKIVTRKYLVGKGISPNNGINWANA